MPDDPLGAWLRGGDDATSPAPSPPAAPPRDKAFGGGAIGASRETGSPLDEEDGRRSRPRRRLVALAVAPWVAVVVLAAVALAPDTDGAAPAAPSAAPSPSSSGAPSPRAVGADASEADSAGVDGAARAAAVLAVRAAVTDGAAPDAPRYVDLAAAEAVERVGDLAVVTVVALVLEGDGEGWQDARTARYAVPVRTTAGAAVPSGRPWPLPAPETAGPEPAWTPVAAPDASAVAAALAAAGYRDVTDARISSSPDLPGVLRAEARAVAPGEAAASDHVVLLRDARPPAVLGAPVAAPSDVPSAPPSRPPSPVPSAVPSEVLEEP